MAILFLLYVVIAVIAVGFFNSSEDEDPLSAFLASVFWPLTVLYFLGAFIRRKFKKLTE